ncbi:MAG: sulfite exporter TauE/SafE family protein [Bacteroidales bacterium]|nr:sulfite exporter TauE/SafE family protein [Bacteroidales bacterium]
MEWYLILAVIGVGFLAGFINTLAGSGSLLSLPMLMFLGLPANVANGTNRIAILLQNVVGVGSFRQQKVLDTRMGLWLAAPAVIGSLVGAQIAIELNEQVMERVIGALLIAMFFLILYKPAQWVKGQAGQVRAKPSMLQFVIFFVIGIYGGFIQAGVGLFLLAGLVLGAGVDLVRANAMKLLIVLIYTPFALAIFFLNDQVDWKIGLILAVGNMLGAFVASRFAVSWGARYVRYILLTVIFASALKLLHVFEWIASLL